MASDITGAAGAYSQYQADQAAAGDTTGDTTGDPAATPEAGAEAGAEADIYTDTTTGSTYSTDLPGVPGGAHGGYLSSSGILAPYHKKLIDGLYAGGRINY